MRLAPNSKSAGFCATRVYPNIPKHLCQAIIASMDLTVPTDVEDAVSDRVKQQFYTALGVNGSTGSEKLDALLQKGLYGENMPAELKGRKAADAFQAAFDLIGGIPRLALWADKNETQFYSLYSKLIPSSTKSELHAKITIDAPWMNPNRLGYRNQGTDSQDGVIDVTPTEPKEPSA